MTDQEKQALIAQLQKCPYLVTFGGTSGNLGPLDGPPTVTADVETTDVTLYETEGNIEASYLTKNEVTVSVKTRAIATAMAMVSGFTTGQNLLASTLKKTLLMVPIDGGTGSTLTFGNAYLQPGYTFTPGEDGEPATVDLTFTCKADATTGKCVVVS